MLVYNEEVKYTLVSAKKYCPVQGQNTIAVQV